MGFAIGKLAVRTVAVAASATLAYDTAKHIKESKTSQENFEQVQKIPPPPGTAFYAIHGGPDSFKAPHATQSLCIDKQHKIPHAHAQKHDNPAYIPVYVKTDTSYIELQGKARFLGADQITFDYSKIKVDITQDATAGFKKVITRDPDTQITETQQVQVVTNNCEAIRPEGFSESGSFVCGKPFPVAKDTSYIGKGIGMSRRLLGL